MSRCSTAKIALLLWVVLISLGCERSENALTQRPSGVPGEARGYEQISENLYARSLRTPKSSGGPRFAKLENCGVDFGNYMSRDITSMVLETGSGIALGDYDGDGLIDIYLTGSDVSNKLYRNLGDLKFEDVTDRAGVDGTIRDATLWASGASFADIDNDGDLDLYVCNMAAPDLLYVNQGDGTFAESGFFRGTGYNGASKQANFCDYDHDGDLDFYLVTYQDVIEYDEPFVREVDGKMEVVPGKEEYAAIIDGHVEYWTGEQDLLYRNDGSGNFEEVAQSSGIEGYACGLASVWFDYDNDGWQDLYVTSDFKQPDRLYRNNRDGTFTDVLPETVRRTPWFSMGVDAGDLNNDGLLDLLVADMADRTHFRQKLNMGDMASSGWMLTYGRPRQFMINCLFLNAGDAQFLEFARQAGLAKTDWTWSVRFADLDLDGNQDVFFTNGHARDNMNSDLSLELKELKKQKGDAELTFAERLEYGIKIPARHETNLAYANRGDLEFESVGKAWGLDFHGVSHSAGFADLDLDGDLDCVINNYYAPSIVYENTTTGRGRLLVELRSSIGNVFGIGSKVEIWQGEDYQRRDLLPGRGYLTSDPMMVHFGVKQGQKIDRLKVTWPDAHVQGFTNLDANQLYRIIDDSSTLPEPSHPPLKALFSGPRESGPLVFKHNESDFDDFQREPLLPFQLSRLGGSVSCGDVNGDGLVDVFCGGAAGQSGALFVNIDGKYQKRPGPWEFHSGREDMSCLFFDADGDGRTDLYVTSGSNEFDTDSNEYRDRLYRNLGNDQFEDVTEDALPDLTDSSISVEAADFDRDGDLDLFVGSRSVPAKYPLPPESHLLINNRGKFTKASPAVFDSSKIGLVNSALWSDFNDDGWVDLVVATEWGPILIFQNSEGTLVDATDRLGLGQQLGWWHGIAAADLDSDGDMDYVVTNQGRNTKYHATVERPHRLYYEDFDGNGSLDLVESEFEGSIEYPVRGRSCSARCMPFIGEKYKTFRDYSLATLDDIYDTESTNRQHVELNYLDSVVLWNNSGAGFEMEPLPAIAQNSPSYGVVVRDFDGDGHQDIMLANNFFGAQPETGYMDGGLGLLLKGNSSREFFPQWPNRSGILVPGDANGLAAADLDGDGDQDVLFAINDGPIKVFLNQSELKFVRFALEGPPENRAGIGTTIKIRFKTRTQVQAYEISSGAGYLSQSFSQVCVAANLLGDVEKISVRWPDGSKYEVKPEVTQRKGAGLMEIQYQGEKED